MKLHIRRKKKGFTLIELITVVSIIMILALLLVPNVIGYINRSKIAVVKNDARAVLNVIKTAKISSSKPENISTYNDAIDTSKGGDESFKTSKTPPAKLININEDVLQGIIDNNSLDWSTYKEYYKN